MLQAEPQSFVAQWWTGMPNRFVLSSSAAAMSWPERPSGRAARVESEPWAGQTDSDLPPASERTPYLEQTQDSGRRPVSGRKTDSIQQSALSERTGRPKRTDFALPEPAAGR